MAETYTRAFGRYLRTLRERQGLSLDEVVSLSQTFPEKINKGYLSRVENGHQKLALPKLIPLARIYHVDADVLVERMELDMEVVRVVGSTPIEGTYSELTDAASAAVTRGERLLGYAYQREAIIRARVDPVTDRFDSRDQMILISEVYGATCARANGKFRFALNEYTYASERSSLGSAFRPLVLERLATCYRALGQLEKAELASRAAISEARALDNSKYLGYAYHTTATVVSTRGDKERAIELHQLAYTEFKNHGLTAERAVALCNLGQLYLDVGRDSSARRACEASLTLAREHGLRRQVALSQVLLGELEERAQNHTAAWHYWKRASNIAKTLNDKELRFKADFQLFRRARLEEKESVARAIKRRLIKLAAAIPESTEELIEFQRLQ